jgi:elongation of very long chain fatty acids protein 6
MLDTGNASGWPVQDASYNSLWSEHWDEQYWVQWHDRNWAICIPLALLYIAAVHWGVYMMRDRKPYNLRTSLGLWSAALGMFSIAGTYYLLPELISSFRNDGFHAAACDNKFIKDRDLVFWGWLFVWSKLFEFGDTAFIVLRKQKLSFLHWFHHALTLICVFSYFPGHCSINRWTGSMNFAVHSIMYSYYAFKAFKVKIPRPIAFAITCSQIGQMLIGLGVAAYIFAQKLSGNSCQMTLGKSIFSFSVYCAYFALFVNFFVHSYLGKSRPATVVKTLGTVDKKDE